MLHECEIAGITHDEERLGAISEHQDESCRDTLFQCGEHVAVLLYPILDDIFLKQLRERLNCLREVFRVWMQVVGKAKPPTKLLLVA